ncbi:biogenesis of lysosome-related organelles complex 1 subunit 6-like [Diorhabda carinulata]|uniref:biogenesis of lysosome-related organelles complex 1 subunit 6-like n=1 Tax=Diorhabda carinulata TaxID=1163345 RepID=UPI0025A0D6EE|nr:biogenesis of lysosome-related organelles complex 1 subunit 6-like [Diorhabda carinulata]
MNPYNDAINDLSKGFVSIYKPSLTNIQMQLTELTSKQNMLIIQMHDENIDLADVQHSPEIQELFKKMNLYQNKLITIRKAMKQLHERSTKLTNRALRLQQIREKEKFAKLQSELDLKREEELIGSKPDKSESVN